MIDFVNFRFAYGERTLWAGINLTVNKSMVTGVLGPNGCGKSTLLSCLQKFVSYEGSIMLENKNLQDFKQRELASIMATVPQVHKPSFPYTVLDIVLTGRAAYVSYLPGKEDVQTAEASLEMIGILDLANRPYTQLSGGERQLVMIARALCQEPQIILFDEPTSFLDLKNQHNTMEIISNICSTKGVTCMVTLHDPNMALSYCDEVILFNDQTLLKGTPQEVINPSSIQSTYGVTVDVISYDNRDVVIPKINSH